MVDKSMFFDLHLFNIFSEISKQNIFDFLKFNLSCSDKFPVPEPISRIFCGEHFRSLILSINLLDTSC